MLDSGGGVVALAGYSGRSRTLADWTKGQPAYQQVADALRERIRCGTYGEGTRIPSYADLMQEFDVSVTVARSAVSMLRTEGLLVTHQGKGAFVRAGVVREMPGGESDGVAALRRDLERLTDRVAELEAGRRS